MPIILGQTRRAVYCLQTTADFLQTGTGYAVRQIDLSQIPDPIPGPVSRSLADVFQTSGRHSLPHRLRVKDHRR